MAERMMVVCDVCGEPASATVGIRVGGRPLTKDLCGAHLSELTSGARAARRGRPRKVATAEPSKAKPSRAKPSRAKPSRAKRTTTRARTAKTGARTRRRRAAAPQAQAT